METPAHRRLALSPDGSRLASAGGSELVVWQVDRGSGVRTLAGQPGVASAVTWEPSGEHLISGGSDGRLRWWDLRRQECVREQETHQGMVQAIKVSPDGSRLASCGDDGAIRLWDLERGEPPHTLCRDRLYERLNITGIRGLTEAEIATLWALGVVEDEASTCPEPAAQR